MTTGKKVENHGKKNQSKFKDHGKIRKDDGNKMVIAGS